MRFSKSIIDNLVSNKDSLINAIEKIEDEINKLKNAVVNEKDIIDKIFIDYYKFDYTKFEELKKIKIYNSNFSSFSSDVDLRFSSKFHRPTGKFVEKELFSITNKKIKHYLSMPIITGRGISPEDYDENGEYCYTSMADIKNWELGTDDIKYVSDEFAKRNKSKKPRGMKEYFPTTLEIDDILMARSGEGTIGKVAIVQEEIDGIFCDFIMRIKLKNYNSLFAYYYFRTTYPQYLIEVYKKGLGNNTNIFPIVIQEFPIPNISLEEQQKLVDAINNEISKQNKIKESMEQ